MRARGVARKPALDAAALEVYEELASAGVDALLLKGVAVAHMLYRPSEHRGYFDVDLLVAPAGQTAAGAVLDGLGYSNLSEMRGVDDVAGILHAHHWSRVVPGFGNVSVDLHWRLAGCASPPEVVWAALSRSRTTILLGGRQVPTLGRGGQACHLALHAAQHGPGDLKTLGDLKRSLNRWPFQVWAEATELAYELEAVGAFAAGLRLLASGTALADELGLPKVEAELWAIRHRDRRPRGVFHLDAFGEAASARERCAIVRRSLLPKRSWIVHEHPWAARGRVSLLAAYLLQGVRSAGWATRAWRFRRQARRAAPTHTES